jgi:hypothetical protein
VAAALRARAGGGAAALSLLLLLAGCANFHLPFTSQDSFSQDDLRSELTNYVGAFSAGIRSASEDIADATRDLTVRRRTVLWRLRMIPAMQNVAFRDVSAQESFALVLTLAIMQRQYLTDGDGRDLFGPEQPIATGVARDLELRVLDIGSQFLSREQLERVAHETDALARHYPIRGRDFSFQQAIGAAQHVSESSSLGWLITLPLSPFRALQGVDTGAQAIRDFNQTAREFAQIISALPDQLRLQIELVLYDVEDRETVVRGLAAFESLAESAAQASDAVQRLPDDLRGALSDSKDALGQAAATVDQARGLMTPLDSASQNLRDASADWLSLIGTRADRDKDTSPPFDIRDWQNTAQQIGTSAAELRGLANDLRALGGGGDSLSAAVDRAFWRGIELIAVFFAALLVYRALASRITRAPGPPPSAAGRA